MKSNDKSLPLPVLLKSMTEELHITDLPEGCSNTEVQAVRKRPPAKKPSPRETRGFSHAGIALAPRGTRATRNAI